MNVPSRVSNRLIPAANSSGRQTIAYQGRPDAAPEPAITIRVTSVAVSKPRPSTMPTGNIWPGRVIERVARLRTRARKPRESRCFSSSASSYCPARIARNTRRMPSSATRLSAAIRYRKAPDAVVPMVPST